MWLLTPVVTLVEIAVALKLTVRLGLLARVGLIAWPPLSPVLTYVLSLGLLLAGGAGLVLAVAVLVKLRWRRLPNLFAFALTAGGLACFVVALRGAAELARVCEPGTYGAVLLELCMVGRTHLRS